MIPALIAPLAAKAAGWFAGRWVQAVALIVLSAALIGGWHLVNHRWCNLACQGERQALQDVIRTAAENYARDLEAAQVRAQAEREAKDAIAAEHAASLAEARATEEALRRALSRAQAVTRPEPTDANPDPDVRLAGGWLQCWAALASGDPEDARACQVRGDELPVERAGDGPGRL